MTVTYRRRKKRTAPLLIPILIISLILLVIGGYFGYNKYLEIAYPIKYQSWVEKYAAENHLNKYFVYAVIKTESGFDPSAESNVGARGLMQIMEDTFDWIKFKLDDDNAVYGDMYDAQTNIRYGCYLLGYLMDEFGSVEVAAAAYHAGRGNVNSWLSDKKYSADGVHLDNIPISDTAHYVNKITKAMNKYIKLYDNTT
ncbi:MAG: lytic transglycosylase domain-containing protein [Oscillospiraceae bacterium]|nr:lytic transglycosylase domain-containing protein [Oscillospiraceae bacterium]